MHIQKILDDTTSAAMLESDSWAVFWVSGSLHFMGTRS